MALELVIVTPEGEAFTGAVQSVVLPGNEGAFGVLPGHERFLSPLAIGEMEIRDEVGATTWAAISDGFVEVSGDKVVVMVDSCELASNIDVARAERARENAQRQLEAMRRQHAEEMDFRLQELALQRALTRLEVAKHL